MGRIFAVISVVVFAVALGCGEEPGSIGNQGEGSGGGGSVSPVDVDEECFDFGENPKAAFDGDAESGDYKRWVHSDYWSRWSPISTGDIGNPECVIDGVGYAWGQCEELEAEFGQEENYNVCYEYRDNITQDRIHDVPCMWRVVAEVYDGACMYYSVCLTEGDWVSVPTYNDKIPEDYGTDYHFPDGWDEAVDKYCVD